MAVGWAHPQAGPRDLLIKLEVHHNSSSSRQRQCLLPWDFRLLPAKARPVRVDPARGVSLHFYIRHHHLIRKRKCSYGVRALASLAQ